MRACIKLAYDVTRYTLKNTPSYGHRTNKVIYTYSGHSFPVKHAPKKKADIMANVNEVADANTPAPAPMVSELGSIVGDYHHYWEDY